MRSPATVLFLIGFFFIKFAHSQTTSNELIIFGQTGKLYLEHPVVAKENWYSVGRLYNTSPKELAPFNHTALTQPLLIGQILQIPLTTRNFSQNNQKAADETLVPVYYVTQEKEWMYRISVNHNKVPITSLEKWNNLNKDAVRPGMHLIVGYLRVKTALSALATTPPSATIAAAPVEKPAAEKPAAEKTMAAQSTDTPIVKHVVSQAPVAANPTPTITNNAPSSPHFDGGVFKSDFLDNGKTVSGMAGVFKSTSGWQDGKYYALMNNVAIGIIVKVTDPANGKSVFVKVLGQLPDMKESVGLSIRISNAAAAELGATGDRFTIRVNY